MAEPTTVEISHTLGRAEARRRLASRIGELASHIPGGIADVHSSWPGEDRMALEVTALGQKIAATIDVEDRVLRVTLLLPGMLGFFANTIAGTIREKGAQLLLPER